MVDRFAKWGASYLSVFGSGRVRASLTGKPLTMNRILHAFGIDLFIESMPLSGGPFSFSRETHPAACGVGGDREYWGLGLHIVVSPLPLDRATR